MAELSTIARPYAEAVYAAAAANNAVDAWSDVVQALAQIVTHPEVQQVIADPKLSKAQRQSLLIDLLRMPLPDQAERFIALLIDNDRVDTLPAIAEQFDALKNRHEGVSVAHIESAFPLEPTQVADLLVSLEQKFGVKLKPQVTVNATLIGGMKVTVGDQVLDTSVQAQLTRLRDTLVAQ